MSNLIPFLISSVDSLGQGVSKITDKVTFVPKTLPEEEGTAQLLAQKSKVAFTQLVSLTKPSPRRVKPSCPHFEHCPGCHYLHTDYDYELELKLGGMKNLFRHHPDLNHQVIAAPERLGYRNRVQLHYDLLQKKLGLLDARANRIIEVPGCLIANEEVLKTMRELYREQNWLKLAPPKIKKGHVEIYFHQGQIKISWNRPYAEGGFSQVNHQMNEKLKKKLQELTTPLKTDFILDLFAGDGNLSNNLTFMNRLCVDLYQKAMPADYLSLNLYSEGALKKVMQRMAGQQVDLLILDPPRSGLKNLDEWVKATNPSQIIYVSCDPHTQVRDIENLSDYQIKESFLLDLFPGTFHFETMVILDRKS